MQRTFVTEMPETLEANQVVVDLPRYEASLARAFLRRDAQNLSKFNNSATPLNIFTTVNQVKMFVDELAQQDKEISVDARIPYGNFAGLKFETVGDAVTWARKFVQRYFADTEERFIKKALLNIPFEKTEIVWLGGERYLAFVQRVAMSPSTEDLIAAQPTTQRQAPLTREEATKKRAEIAAKKEAELAVKRGKTDTTGASAPVSNATP